MGKVIKKIKKKINDWKKKREMRPPLWAKFHPELYAEAERLIRVAKDVGVHENIIYQWERLIRSESSKFVRDLIEKEMKEEIAEAKAKREREKRIDEAIDLLNGKIKF